MIRQKAVKAVALFLALSLFQLYVRASAAESGVGAQDPAASAPQTLGKLSTSGNRKILADKNEVSTGATILDGMTLETSDCVSATVRFGPLDEVNLATNTIAVINYSNGKVKVTLKKGCARIRVQRSVDGTIETPDGKTTPATQPAPPNRQLAEVCYLLTGAKSDFNPSCAPFFSLIYVGGIAGGLAGIIALVAVSSGAAAGAANASDSAPS
jgi:hypothetical protein